jgi:hypothetical protein
MFIPEQERPSDATLAEWIRHCKRAASMTRKILYEKGGLNLDNLTDEVMAAFDEEVYQVLCQELARSSDSLTLEYN